MNLENQVNEIDKDLYNHKYFRPKVFIVDDNLQMYSLLIPDITFFIFNFIYDSEPHKISFNYEVDSICKQKYQSQYAYPLVLYINTTFLENIGDKTLLFPNNLTEFANTSYRSKYTTYIETSIEPNEEDLRDLLKTRKQMGRTERSLTDIFGPIFVEA